MFEMALDQLQHLFLFVRQESVSHGIKILDTSLYVNVFLFLEDSLWQGTRTAGFRQSER